MRPVKHFRSVFNHSRCNVSFSSLFAFFSSAPWPRSSRPFATKHFVCWNKPIHVNSLRKHGLAFFKGQFSRGGIGTLLNPSFRLLHGSPASPESIVQVTRRSHITLSKQKALRRHLHASTVSEATSQPRSTPMPNEAPENCHLKKKMGLTQSAFTCTPTNYIYLITTAWNAATKQRGK